jgi:basic amino acid/polyamine antiporter, APA family
VQGWLLAWDLPICGVSVLFSLRVTFASGYQAVYQALILVLAGLVLYAFLNPPGASRPDPGTGGQPARRHGRAGARGHATGASGG